MLGSIEYIDGWIIPSSFDVFVCMYLTMIASAEDTEIRGSGTMIDDVKEYVKLSELNHISVYDLADIHFKHKASSQVFVGTSLNQFDPPAATATQYKEWIYSTDAHVETAYGFQPKGKATDDLSQAVYCRSGQRRETSLSYRTT